MLASNRFQARSLSNCAIFFPSSSSSSLSPSSLSSSSSNVSSSSGAPRRLARTSSRSSSSSAPRPIFITNLAQRAHQVLGVDEAVGICFLSRDQMRTEQLQQRRMPAGKVDYARNDRRFNTPRNTSLLGLSYGFDAVFEGKVQRKIVPARLPHASLPALRFFILVRKGKSRLAQNSSSNDFFHGRIDHGKIAEGGGIRINKTIDRLGEKELQKHLPQLLRQNGKVVHGESGRVLELGIVASGEGGIRTHGSACGTTRDFQSRSFGLSDTSPIKRQNAKREQPKHLCLKLLFAFCPL